MAALAKMNSSSGAPLAKMQSGKVIHHLTLIMVDCCKKVNGLFFAFPLTNQPKERGVVLAFAINSCQKKQQRVED